MYNNHTTSNTLNTLGTPMSAKRYFDNNDDEFNRRRAHRRFERDRRERERKENHMLLMVMVVLAIIAIATGLLMAQHTYESLERFTSEYTPEEWQQVCQEYYLAHPEQFGEGE